MEAPPIAFWIALVLVIGFGVAAYAWRRQRAAAVLNQWLQKKGFTVLWFQHVRFTRLTPFGWKSNTQLVYRVRVKTKRGREREGYAKVGDFWWGLLDDSVVLKWDDDGD